MIRLRALDHVVIRVKDIDAMRRFYCEVLGAEHVAYRPQLRMSHLRAGTSMIDLVEGKTEEPGHNMDHFCLKVEPLDEAEIVAHLKRYDVAVGDIRTRFGAEGNGVSIYLTDPEGNTVELKGPSDGQRSPPPT
jgi:glyoxylase I family protein